jgi:hypothetical protein
MEPANLGLEYAILIERDFSEPAATKLHFVLGKVSPVYRKDEDRSEVEHAIAKIVLTDPVGFEEAGDIEIVNRHRGVRPNGRAVVSGLRFIEQSIEEKVHVVIGEAEHLTIGADNLPASAEGRDLLRQVGGHPRRNGLH